MSYYEGFWQVIMDVVVTVWLAVRSSSAIFKLAVYHVHMFLQLTLLLGNKNISN